MKSFSIDDGFWAEGIVEVRLHEIQGMGFQEFQALLSEKLTGSPNLENLYFRLVEYRKPDTLVLEVEGDATKILENANGGAPADRG